jgi:hypothetical protein
MAVINDPNIAAQVAQVGMGAGTTWTPQHVAGGPLPVGTGGAFRLSMVSGTLAAAIAANSELFQFRYVTGASRVCLVHGISVSAGANVAATAAAILSLRATVARAWTVAGSGGTRATMTGNNNKLRTAHTTSEVSDIGMATTAALTAGTKTLDSQDIGGVAYGVGTGAITTSVPLNLLGQTDLLGEFAGALGFPLVLANQEGFVVRTGIIQPATMTWNLTVNVAWTEVQSF